MCIPHAHLWGGGVTQTLDNPRGTQAQRKSILELPHYSFCGLERQGSRVASMTVASRIAIRNHYACYESPGDPVRIQIPLEQVWNGP